MKVNYLKFKSNKIPSSSYIISDRLTLIPVQRMIRDTIDSELMICNVYGIDRGFLIDYGIYHALITGEIWILQNLDSLLKTVETKKIRKIDDFINEQEAFLMKQDANYPDYDKITPINKLPLEMKYKEGYLRYLDAKSNELKIYEQIQLFVFTMGFSSWQPFYDNLNLKDALNYTILDSVIGQPSWCKGKSYCDCCSKDIPHTKPSLTSYTREQLKTYLNELEPKDRDLYIKLFNKIVGVRGGTYHDAIYYNVLREMVREVRSFDTQKWTLEHTVKNFSKPTGRNVANIRFSNLVKFILIKELLDCDIDARR